MQPVNPSQRIEIIDILRGFALSGILFANIRYFSGYEFMPFETLKLFPTNTLDTLLSDILEVVISAKFYTLFSILFAVGFFLQYNRNQDDPASFFKIYQRRLLVLLIIGVIHGLIWFGDILLTYSILGFLLILFRNAKPKRQFLWAIVFIFFFVAGDMILMPIIQNSSNFPQTSTESLAHTQYPDMTPEAVMTQFKDGNIQELFALNLHHIVWKMIAQLSSGRYLTILGLFVLGYYLASIQFFKEKIQSTSLLIFSGIVGFAAIFLARWIGGSLYHFPPSFSNVLYKFLFTISQIFICLFYVTSLAKILHTGPGKKILHFLKPVGRMALTNYLSQTLICVILFYNFGFDLAAELGFVHITLIALGILSLQIVIGNIWMKYFRFGPIEWLWRSLTYKNRIRIRTNGFS